MTANYNDIARIIPSLSATYSHLELALIINTDLPFVPTTAAVVPLILLNSKVRNFSRIHVKPAKLKLLDVLLRNNRVSKFRRS